MSPAYVVLGLLVLWGVAQLWDRWHETKSELLRPDEPPETGRPQTDSRRAGWQALAILLAAGVFGGLVTFGPWWAGVVVPTLVVGVVLLWHAARRRHDGEASVEDERRDGTAIPLRASCDMRHVSDRGDAQGTAGRTDVATDRVSGALAAGSIHGSDYSPDTDEIPPEWLQEGGIDRLP